MKIRILSWNVRGLCSADRRAIVKAAFDSWSPDIIMLQETRCCSVNSELIREVWSNCFCNLEVLLADESAGGILLMWDRRVVEKLDSSIGFFTISVLSRNTEDSQEWALAGVYGPNDSQLQRNLWSELDDVVAKWPVPWCIGGDLNVVRFTSERLDWVGVESRPV